MELDSDFSFNFTSIVCTLLLTIVTCVTVFHKLRIRWPVRVNCWFCNNYNKIWAQESDWWRCSSCEQFNGFSKDGDYKYEISEQYEKPSNRRSKSYLKCDESKSFEFDNGLCAKCNENEERKIRELRRFEPSDPKNYDVEAERFEKMLERKYSLCPDCERVVRNVLREQSSWLTRYKMLFFKRRPIQLAANNGARLERVLRISLVVLSSSMFRYVAFWPLPLAGVFLQLTAGLVGPAAKRSLHVLLTFLWIFIGVLTPFEGLKVLKADPTYQWFGLEYVTQYHVVVTLTSAIGLANVISKPHSATANAAMAFKKLGPSPKMTNDDLPPIPSAKDIEFDATAKAGTPNSNRCRSPVNITSLLMTPVSVEAPVPVKPPIFSQSFSTFQRHPHSSPRPFRFDAPPGDEINLNSLASAYSRRTTSSGKSYSLDDSLSTLRSLSLSDNRPKRCPRTPRVFETKVYGTVSPDIFAKSTRWSNKRFALTPPKLKSVAQSSWVAGGYWQTGMEVPSLSRSSSQSSGFGSAGSNLGPSREPSVYNDFDRCSVMSDGTQYCYATRPNGVHTMLGPSRYQLGGPPSYSFPRPESPISGHSARSTPSCPAYFGKYSPTVRPLSAAKRLAVDANENPRGSDIDGETPSRIGQTPQIFASPVWLPAMLCGSLVFNMIVLCTTLLR